MFFLVPSFLLSTWGIAPEFLPHFSAILYLCPSPLLANCVSRWSHSQFFHHTAGLFLLEQHLSICVFQTLWTCHNFTMWYWKKLNWLLGINENRVEPTNISPQILVKANPSFTHQSLYLDLIYPQFSSQDHSFSFLVWLSFCSSPSTMYIPLIIHMNYTHDPIW